MEELVTIIEQRNHIINSLDQDRQREKEEDVLFSMIKKKDLKKRIWERPEDVKSKVQAHEDAEVELDSGSPYKEGTNRSIFVNKNTLSHNVMSHNHNNVS
ncbi:unnamed protein product [Oncorhynchus mykiss]|uniref:BMERB domain-containing protein n=1 Tax=Oncorhynchus mykiss TaxID=8022 RepID=A0A060XBY8_ONCMY|nr:unnamed protein product [Oncorhynchus mykiss]